MNKIEIAPSILSADFCRLEEDVKRARDAGADRIHCDVMDGHFVPNITFGPMVIEAVKRCVSIPLDVHLMIADPSRYIDAFCRAGADVLTIHAETGEDLPAAAAAIRKHGVRPGITVNPDKPVDLFLPHLALFDQVLIMSVYAGFGGQKFINETLTKMKTVWEQAQKQGLSIDLQVDGGINHETALLCAQHGVNVLVAGSYVFGSPDYRQRIEAIRQAALTGQRTLQQ